MHTNIHGNVQVVVMQNETKAGPNDALEIHACSKLSPFPKQKK